MTITFVGAGTSVTGNNTAVQPVVAGGTVAGDLVVVHVSIGNPAAAWGAQPAGWNRIAGLANHRVYGRIWQTGDVVPSFSPLGGAAGDDTIGSTFTLRGVEPNVLSAAGGVDTSPVQTNASAQDIAYPALTVPGANHALLRFVWKRDDATSYATPGAWVIASPMTSTTIGNDASHASYYLIQTTAANVGTGSVVVTGGAAAVSSAIMLYLRPAAAIAVSEQPTYPARVLVSVTGLTLGDTVSVYREVDGVQTLLRAGFTASATDPSFLVLDAELPFGVPITYVAVVNSAITYTSATATYTLVGGKVAISDAITGLSAEVMIQEWTSKDYTRQNTVFRVGARNIVVTGALGQFTGELTLYTETTSSALSLMDVLRDATGGTVQIRQPGGYDDIDAYVVVTRVTPTRYDTGDGTDDRRLFALDATETDPWASTLAATGYTLQDIADAYTGMTLLDISNDYSTLLEISQEIWP